MTYMHPDRAMIKKIADINGYFWLPCPTCNEPFAGHEWFNVNGHQASIPRTVNKNEDGTVYSNENQGICPNCCAQGVGCRAHHAAGLAVHADCAFIADSTQTEIHSGHTRLP